MGIRRRTLKGAAIKTVTATQRLPLWKMCDDMYINRQLAPSKMDRWKQIKATQVRMMQRVKQQQIKDMQKYERELSGQRLPPTHHVGDLRPGMWLEGRISRTKNFGVMVDMGVYNDSGEWVDGYMKRHQIREDGGHVRPENIHDEVYLGERVRVRIREVEPATGSIEVSMRTIENLPALFMGKPRPYILMDLEVGMKVKGIIRHAWDGLAMVDIGADRLARIHVSRHPTRRKLNGLYRARQHRFAYTAFPIGAVMDLYILIVHEWGQIELSGWPVRRGGIGTDGDRGLEVFEARQIGPRDQVDEQNDFMTNPADEIEKPLSRTEKQYQQRKAAESKEFEPGNYGHLNSWIKDALEPNAEMDSWVANTEKEIFEEQGGDESDDEFIDFDEEEERAEDPLTKAGWSDAFFAGEDEDDEEEEFADDEFAEDDFADGGSLKPSEAGFGPNAFPASDLDGWVLEKEDTSEAEGKKEKDELDMVELEQMFDEEDDDAWEGSQRR